MFPEQFLTRMQSMLGTEYDQFVEALDTERYRALRLNPLKGRDLEEARQKLPWPVEAVPWEPLASYYKQDSVPGEASPGKSPLHEAGAYYIQEPSAMVPVTLLNPRPGEKILDLCAAPGGKTTQIAGRMAGKGLLIANEIMPNRARILSENVERMGVRNCIVTNETPDKLAEYLPGFFDCILVDAPCSGEGMFRKNENAGDEWSPENVQMCADRQRDVMEAAWEMLRYGGRLVYSTCTFAPAEDEDLIVRFVKEHEDAHILPAIMQPGYAPGRPEWVSEEADIPEDLRSQAAHTVRLWPHLLKGEGHFAAILCKGEPSSVVISEEMSVSEGGVGWAACNAGVVAEKTIDRVDRKRDRKTGKKNGKGTSADNTSEQALRLWQEFAAQNLTEEGRIGLNAGTLSVNKEQIYLLPLGAPSLRGLKVLRPGLHLGTVEKNRFEPAHALGMALGQAEVLNRVEVTASDPRAKAWIRGEGFREDTENGWLLVLIDGFSIGWGKAAQGMIKNHYPKGLRKELH